MLVEEFELDVNTCPVPEETLMLTVVAHLSGFDNEVSRYLAKVGAKIPKEQLSPTELEELEVLARTYTKLIGCDISISEALEASENPIVQKAVQADLLKTREDLIVTLFMKP